MIGLLYTHSTRVAQSTEPQGDRASFPTQHLAILELRIQYVYLSELRKIRQSTAFKELQWMNA